MTSIAGSGVLLGMLSIIYKTSPILKVPTLVKFNVNSWREGDVR